MIGKAFFVGKRAVKYGIRQSSWACSLDEKPAKSPRFRLQGKLKQGALSSERHK